MLRQDWSGEVRAHLLLTPLHYDGGTPVPLYPQTSARQGDSPRTHPDDPNWVVPDDTLQRCEKLYCPHTIDLFADKANRRFCRFSSAGDDPAAEWQDALP